MHYTNNMKIIYSFIFTLSLFLGSTSAVYAVETAPRISDREIIESLAELKAGHKIMENRFDSMENRFDSMENRFDSMENNFNSRFIAIDQRLDSLFNVITTAVIAIFATILGLVGFILWDRRSMTKPLELRLDQIEHDLNRDLELQNKKGSLIARIIQALSKMAETDKKFAKILHQLSLL